MKQLLRLLFPLTLLMMLLTACAGTPSDSTSSIDTPGSTPVFSSSDALVSNTPETSTIPPSPGVEIRFEDGIDVSTYPITSEFLLNLEFLVPFADTVDLSVKPGEFGIYHEETNTWKSEYSCTCPLSQSAASHSLTMKYLSDKPSTGYILIILSDEKLQSIGILYYASDGEYFALSRISIPEAQKALQ